MRRTRKWYDERADDLRSNLTYFEIQGDLTHLSPEALFSLINLTDSNLAAAHQLCSEHERHGPSAIWFWIAIVSGFGGLLYLEPSIGSMIVTFGGAAGAAKAIYDRGEHLIQEQVYLSLYWHADRHRAALAAELTRRGVRF